MKKKRFSDEQIVALLREAEGAGQTIAEVCRAPGISAPTFYVWRRKFGHMPQSAVERLKELEKENSRLKRLLAERDVEVDVMKELWQKK